MEILSRAEDIKKNKLGGIQKKTSGGKATGGSITSSSKDDGEEKKEKKEDEDSNKLIAQLKDAIVKREDLKTTWDDVAGLEVAKESLKEAVILPTKFP